MPAVIPAVVAFAGSAAAGVGGALIAGTAIAWGTVLGTAVIASAFPLIGETRMGALS